jgi:predicted PurR-regulated permease PerM
MSEPSGNRPDPTVASRVPGLGSDALRAARREFERRVVRGTLIVDAVVVVTVVVTLIMWRLRAILLLVVVALFLAAVLHPMVRVVERRGLRRGLATAVVFLVAFLAVVAIGAAIINPIISSATHFVKVLPTLVSQAEKGKGQIGHLVSRFHLLNFIKSKQSNLESIVAKVGKPALAVGKTVVSGLAAVVTIMFLTFFLLLEAPRIAGGILHWMQPERASRVRNVLDQMNKAIVGYMLGNILTSVIAGIVVGTTLYLLGVPFPVVLAVWVALVDFLPMIGGLLAGVPTVIIAALHSLPAGIVTLIVFLVYQEVENHLLNPVIMSRTVRLNPLWVMLAVLLGAELGDIVGSLFGGLIGALLAVPTAGAIQVIARDLWLHRTGAALLGLSTDGAGGDTEDGTGADEIAVTGTGKGLAGGIVVDVDGAARRYRREVLRRRR